MKELNLKVEMVSIDELIPYDNNPKLHDDKQIDQVARSIKEFGFNDPIAINSGSNVIITGHARLEAAKRLGLKEVPVIKLDHLDEYERRAYGIAHNKLNLLTGFDDKILSKEFSTLEGMNIDLTITGFDKPEIADVILRASGEAGLASEEAKNVERHRTGYLLPFVFTRGDKQYIEEAVDEAVEYFEADSKFEGLKRMCERFVETITQEAHHTG